MADPASLVSDARSYASSIQSSATTAINGVITALSNTNPWVFAPEWEDTDEPIKVVLDEPPVIDPISLELPPEPFTEVPYQGISAIEIGIVPEFDITAPVFSEPNKPNQLADFNQQAPTITTNFVFPEPPSALQNPTFTIPVISTYTAPVRPEYSIPEFTDQVPLFTGTDPGDLAARATGAYHEASQEFITVINGYVDAQLVKINPQYHAQLAAIESQLTTYLAGGTGLKPEVEDAIYSRARGKNNAEARRVRDQALNDTASRGFTLPPGALLSATQQARQAGADNNAKAASEIVVMQAEMEQKNLQFAVSASSSLRTAAVQATLGYMQNLISINGQALDYAKMILGSLIEAYNLSLKLFSARLDTFKAQVALYETKLKIVTVKLDIYRGELAAMESLINVDRLRVDIVKAQIDSLNSLANMYRTQVETVTSRASLEKLKLELFQTQVQSYSAQVAAKNSEWQGFTAQINGQQAQAGLFSAQVSGYAAQMQGFKTRIDAQSEVVRAQIATNQAAADQVKTAAGMFQAIVQARSTETGVKLDIEKLKLANFSEKLKSQLSGAQLELDYYKTKNSLALDFVGQKVKTSIAAAEVQNAKMKAMADAGVAGAGILGNLAGSAMAGMNSLVALTETV